MTFGQLEDTPYPQQVQMPAANNRDMDTKRTALWEPCRVCQALLSKAIHLQWSSPTSQKMDE